MQKGRYHSHMMEYTIIYYYLHILDIHLPGTVWVSDGHCMSVRNSDAQCVLLIFESYGY